MLCRPPSNKFDLKAALFRSSHFLHTRLNRSGKVGRKANNAQHFEIPRLCAPQTKAIYALCSREDFHTVSAAAKWKRKNM